MTFNIF